MNWPTAALGDVCAITMGQAPPGSSYNDLGEGEPLIAGAGDFVAGKPRPKKYTTQPGKVADTGDIVLAIRATIGVKVLADRTYCLGRGVAGLRAGKQIDSRYLWNWLGYAEVSLDAKGRGATFRQVNRNDIATMEIPLPPLPEQRRIAAILDHADTLRARRLNVINVQNQLDDAAFQHFAASKPSVPLGDLLTFVTSGGRGWAKYYADSGERFIRSLDVQVNSISDDDLALVAAPDNAEARRTCTRPGDVLLTITGSRIGRAAALPSSLSGSYISQHVAILRPNAERLLPRYLSAFLCSERWGQRQIRSSQYGQTKPGLNFDQIRDFRVPLAAVGDQQNFSEFAEASKCRRELSREAAVVTEALFDSLQSRAFRGEL